MSEASSPKVIRRDPYSYTDYDSDEEDEETGLAAIPLLTDEELLLTPALLYGFPLIDKLWCHSHVMSASDPVSRLHLP